MLKTVGSNIRCLPHKLPLSLAPHRFLSDATAAPTTPSDIATDGVPEVTTIPNHTRRPFKQQRGTIRYDRKNSRTSNFDSIRDTQKRGDTHWDPVIGREGDPAPSAHRETKGVLNQKIREHNFEHPIAAQTTLRPAVQAARVKELAEKYRPEYAIELVLKAPKYTVDVVTWNTLFSVLMKAQKRKKAYKAYVEMKRRGVKPNTNTFITLLNGMNTIESDDWPNHQELLEMCHKLYAAYEEYAQACIEKNLKRDFPMLSHPRNLYIQILGKSGNYEKVVDIFYGIGDSGPLARDMYLYGALFSALLSRKEAAKPIANLTIRQQNAADARFFWRMLVKDVERGMPVDTQTIRPFLKLMSFGRAADQQLGIEVVRDFYGLAAPGEDAPPARVSLDSYAFHTILELCNKASKHRLCAYFMKQVMDQQQQSKSPNSSHLKIGSRHVSQLLIALDQQSALGSSDESTRAVESIRFLLQSAALEAMKPAKTDRSEGWVHDLTLHPETVTLALNVCRRCNDWESATEIFTLVTRMSAEDFLDDGPVAKGSKEYRSPRERLLNTTAFAHLARTALATGDESKMRQFLRMMSTYGTDFESAETYHNFYKIELAKATFALANTVIKDWPEGEKNVAKELRRRSRGVLANRIPVDRPPYEDDKLGTEKYISKLQQAIDFDLTTR